MMRALALFVCVSNHSLKVEFGQEEGGGGATSAGQEGRIADHSVFVKLGKGSGSLKPWESSVISSGT